MDYDPLSQTPVSPLSIGIGSDETGNVKKPGSVTAQNPLYPAAKGGPLGLHQFLASTWSDFVKANPQYFQGMTPEQAMDARMNPRLSAIATDWYAGQNADYLKKNGITPTPSILGIAHALGPYGAKSALSYSDDTPLTKVFQETQPKMAETILALNPQYKTMTVGQLKASKAHLDTGASSTTAAPAQTAQATPPPFYPMQSNESALAGREPDPLQQFAMVNALMKPVGGQSVGNMNSGVIQALAAANANRSGLPAGYGQGLNNPLLA